MSTPSSDATAPQQAPQQQAKKGRPPKNNLTGTSSSDPQTERPLRSKDKEQLSANKRARAEEDDFENAKQKVQKAFATVETCKRKDTEAFDALRKAEVDITHAEEALKDKGNDVNLASKALVTAHKQLTIAVEQHHRDNIDNLTEKLREASEKLLDMTKQFNDMLDTISEAHKARQAASEHSAKTALQFAEATQQFACASKERADDIDE
jgi:methyl-accepting chemotaxis protein